MVEDSEDDAELLLLELRRGGFAVEARRVDTPAAMAEALDRQAWDVVLSDHNMPRFSSPEALEILRTLAATFRDPADILTRAAELLQPDLGEDRFVTLLFARLHPVERALVCLNAGHPPAYVLDHAGRVRQALHAVCPALGLVPGARIPAPTRVALEEGDCALLLTDGVLESVNAQGEDFGLERALDVVRTHQQEPAAAIVAALCEAARRHAGSGPQRDDITAIVARVDAAVPPAG